MAQRNIDKKGRHWSTLAPPPERYAAFVKGEITVEDMDDEEIQRMQLRAADGSFRGGVPTSLPREFIQAVRVEQQRRFNNWINQAVPAAQEAVMELVKSKKLTPGDATRLKAAQEILERFAGKTPDKVEVKAEVSVFDAAVSDVLMDLDSDEIEEAEVIE